MLEPAKQMTKTKRDSSETNKANRNQRHICLRFGSGCTNLGGIVSSESCGTGSDITSRSPISDNKCDIHGKV
ncbi:hypothetical protein [Shewanella chilikensis]|uniref:Uncharacterized protein n=1 Tax=Shewanella chilikensis TaxID=558541 RepID=A0A6G7LSF1_9GAMM|nr:hypothetical protein [Shewanella chilikensis]QIJ04691.1 hypothetical protein GII14_11385 [Shewanella chilikensis]QIJ04697.1 hypothetical protein GII14_11415 [Shewanella chilikensis]QIJ04703.1 hypothetical protein GII14_11445 [Shewanella chilikensis]